MAFVNWVTDRFLFGLAVVIYGGSTIYSAFLWRKGFRRDDRINYLLLAGAFLFHTAAMAKRGFSLGYCPVHNLYEAIVFIAWGLALAYLGLGWWRRMRFLGALVAPLLFGLGVFALMPALDPAHGPKPEFSGAGLSLHAALVLLAYGALGLAAVAGAMFLAQEHNLKFHKLRAVLSRLPPIQRLQLVARRLSQIGFALLTAGLYYGARLPQPDGVVYFQDAKVIWAGALWLACLVLLVLRWRGLSPRRFAWGVVGLFVFVLLTFWGTHLLSPLHNP